MESAAAAAGRTRPATPAATARARTRRRRDRPAETSEWSMAPSSGPSGRGASAGRPFARPPNGGSDIVPADDPGRQRAASRPGPMGTLAAMTGPSERAATIVLGALTEEPTSTSDLYDRL